jgi:hypothetical protein
VTFNKYVFKRKGGLIVNKRGFMSVVLILVLLFVSACGGGEVRSNTGNPSIDAMDIDTMGQALLRMMGERDTYRREAEYLEDEVNTLREVVRGVQVADPEFPAIVRLEDGTGNVTFSKPGLYVLMPDGGLIFPGARPIGVSNSVRMGGESGVTLNLETLWMHRFDGNRLHLQSSTGIYGVVTIGRIVGGLDMSAVNGVFEGRDARPELRNEWNQITQHAVEAVTGVLDTIPPQPGSSPGRDEQIRHGTAVVGRQMSLNTTVEGQPATIRVGNFVVGEYAVLYTFLYETVRSDFQESILYNLVSNMSMGGRRVQVGF